MCDQKPNILGNIKLCAKLMSVGEDGTTSKQQGIVQIVFDFCCSYSVYFFRPSKPRKNKFYLRIL